MESEYFYDCIVIGVGSMGASTCYYLAQRGLKVLGIEQFDIVHNQGSHGGLSRIIRKAYFEHADYIPLLERAYQNWAKIEAISGQRIFHHTGLLYAGPHGHELLQQVKASADQYKIELEELTAKHAISRFPKLGLPTAYECLFEPDAGYVRPDVAINAYTQTAQTHGATLHTHEKVLQWNTNESEVIVMTDKGRYKASKLIITAGAWSSGLLPGIATHLHVTRQVLAWFKPKDAALFTADRFPCWLIPNGNQDGAYYGFPVIDEHGNGPEAAIKIALHEQGTVVNPDAVDRNITETDLVHLTQFAQKFLPSSIGPLVHAQVCLYTYSPDGHFIIDKLPGYEDRVVVACGFSGHGFKFASAVGEVLADLAMYGKTVLPIGFLHAGRFSALH
jgi:sarcosine oxidase